MQQSLFEEPDISPVYLEGLAHFKYRLSTQGDHFPKIRPYLEQCVERYKKLCAGIPETELGPFPQFPDDH